MDPNAIVLPYQQQSDSLTHFEAKKQLNQQNAQDITDCNKTHCTAVDLKKSDVHLLSSKHIDAEHDSLSRSASAPDLSPNAACDLNRVHEELEKLNIATDVINKLELQLDEARTTFREMQTGWSQRLEQLGKKLGGCIEKSRPYYEARLKVLEAQQEAQRAALRFERGNSLHAVAKQQVALTQESLNRQGLKNVDPACLEVLNHHIQRVNEAEAERLKSEQEHHVISRQVAEATAHMLQLERDLKRSIKKSKAYFDARTDFNKSLEKQKELIQRLECEIKQKKNDYNTSLRNLEHISDKIHEQRQNSSRTVSVNRLAEDENEENVEKIVVVSRISKQEDEVSAPPSDPETDNVRIQDDPVDPLSERPVTLNVTSSSSSLSVNVDENGEQQRRRSLAGGVILLAHELSSAYEDWLENEAKLRQRVEACPIDVTDLAASLTPDAAKNRRRSRTSSGRSRTPNYMITANVNDNADVVLSNDDDDVRYRTTPQGVKPVPSPVNSPPGIAAPFFRSGKSDTNLQSIGEPSSSKNTTFAVDLATIEFGNKSPVLKRKLLPKFNDNHPTISGTSSEASSISEQFDVDDNNASVVRDDVRLARHKIGHQRNDDVEFLKHVFHNAEQMIDRLNRQQDNVRQKSQDEVK